ncbi:stealth conserved region 3 domain-containing protein [Microbacterium sp. SS28]|uniref:stealth conserved region 3 domain-containing protein n=1 Tax=Microbacterium sp. SS28 TaxID=2919948 RepID=UPI001FAB1954|nr:stealth conserved region 3 domain-containing protein [Microbacterium sp. SS28]
MPALSALPVASDTWSSLLRRPDVVIDRGTLHLRHESTTPADAARDDLLLVADALEAAGVATLLVRHDRRTLALVVDVADRDAAFRALSEVGAVEPLYLKPRRGEPVLAAEAASPRDKPSSWRVYRPRISRRGDLRYGASSGARLEFWRFGEIVEAPTANALLRANTPAADIAFSTVERHDRTWRTVDGMFDPQPDEFTEPVDIVFSWVDGSATEFQRQRAAQMAGYVVGEGDDGPARYRQVDELRYALRSVHMYAPWVRRIFIATDSPAPSWLVEHPKVTIVRSDEFFGDTSVLPTHNSHAVEAQLHRIDGLAEHFLYSNDDMFFARPVEPELFFTPAGVTKFVECEVRIGAGSTAAGRSGHDNALRVNRELLRERFDRRIVRDLEHCATPLRRSILAELEEAFPEEIARTAASRFRSATDVSVTNCLYHYYALMTGRAVVTRRPRVRYVQTTLAKSLRGMDELAARRDVDMFCLNDGGEHEIPEDLRVSVLRATLERMFPVRAPWERPAVSAGREEARSAHPSAAR